VDGSEHEISCDCVIAAIGTAPNPLIRMTTPGLAADRHGCLVLAEGGAPGQTTREGVFAGGDAVTGAATVILAMGAGKDAAESIHAYLSGAASRASRA
jgi:glutamate synthase (NADPH/NADH) small chain